MQFESRRSKCLFREQSLLSWKGRFFIFFKRQPFRNNDHSSDKGHDDLQAEGEGRVGDGQLVPAREQLTQGLLKVGAHRFLQLFGCLHVQGLASNSETGLLQLTVKCDEERKKERNNLS